MARCRFVVLFLATLAVYCSACGTGKSALNNRRSVIAEQKLNADFSDLQKNVKRSVEEEDCGDSKKSTVEIKQAAVSAIPGQNEEIGNEKKSNVKGSLDYLVLPNMKENKIRKDKLEKPMKRLHSPLWSLSKLIESVDGKTAKKNNITLEKKDVTGVKINKIEKDEKPVAKTNLALAQDPSKGIKATLSKAIEKVEKVIASKNAKLITPEKAEVKSTKSEPESKKSTNNTTSTAATGDAKVTGDAKTTKSNGTAASAPLTASIKAAVKDPYAEIAMGPDRPKIPELKSDASGEDGPVMRMNNGDVKSMGGGGGAADPAMKNAKPLAGQHDVGGLLDRLTDKLNSQNGVALDSNSPLTEANDVKYVQSPVNLDSDGNDKQAQEFAVDKLKDQADLTDVKKMTEENGMFADGPGGSSQNTQTTQDMTAKLLGAGGSASDSAALKAALAGVEGAAESGLAGGSATEAALKEASRASSSPLSAGASAGSNLDSELAGAFSAASDNGGLPTGEAATGEAASALSGATNGDDEGIAKSLTKASSLTTDAVMDMLKSAKVPGVSDFSNADISAGPDPYADAEGGSEQQQSDSLGSLLGGSKSNTGELTQGLDSSSDLLGGSNSLSDGLSNSDGNDGLSSRSATDTESDDDYERNTIPNEDLSSDSYTNRYNTENFKKHVIMRPKRDTYVSPFNDKEAFDTAV